MCQNLKTLRRETTALGTPEVDGNPGDNSLCYQSKFLAIFLAGEKNTWLIFSPARKTVPQKTLAKNNFRRREK